MSVQITTAFVQQYHNNVQLLSQQKPSLFSPIVRNESMKGEFQYFEQIGAVEAQPAGGRHSDTPRYDTPHARRAVTTTSFDWSDMVDDFDKVRMLIDPTSPYATNAVMAFNRAKDKVIIEAAMAQARTGKDGTTMVALPASQIIDAAAAEALTIDKLIETRQKFWDNNVDESIPLYFAAAPAQMASLLKTTQVTNADYNTVRALVKGEIDTFMGFKFVRSTLIPWASNVRNCFAWAKDGLLLATGINTKVRIGERPDKRYSVQVYVSMDIGATRMEEVKVVQVNCAETQ